MTETAATIAVGAPTVIRATKPIKALAATGVTIVTHEIIATHGIIATINAENRDIQASLLMSRLTFQTGWSRH